LLAIGDVTADQGDVVYLLDINTGELVQTLKKPLAGLSGTRAMAFSPDDVYLAAGGYQMAVYIWNVEWGARVYDLPYPDMGVLAIDFSADSSFIAAGSAGEAGGVMLWDLANEQVIEFPFPVLARDLEFMPNSSILAVATADYKPEAPPHGPIVLWNIEEGTTESILFGEKATALTFTENGELLAAKIDGHLRIWNIPEGKEIDVQNDNLSEWVWRLEWSADGYVAALVEDSINDHTVLLWNEDGRFITHFTTENVKDFVFISGNRLVMSVPRKPLQIYQIQAP
jgi:WD40 repeat protein